MRAIAALSVLLAAAAVAGCGGSEEASGPITVYSGREEELVAPLFTMFTEETGIEVEVRYGDSAELAATIAEEGDNSPADVFFAQDPGSLGAVDAQLEQLPQETLDRVAERIPRCRRALGGHFWPHQGARLQHRSPLRSTISRPLCWI